MLKQQNDFIGLDLTSFKSIHCGGKDQVAYNLLKGFRLLDKDKKMICFAHKDLFPIIERYNSEIKIVRIPNIKMPRGFSSVKIFIEGLILRFKVKKYRVGLLVFTNKNTPKFNFPVKTIVIPHDIQAFYIDRVAEIKTAKKYLLRQQKTIKKDFKYRDFIIAISDFDKSEMIKFMPWAENKIKRIYDPIGFDNDYVSNEDVKEYLTVLNIQWQQKNPLTVIKAFCEIADKIDNKLILVGRYPDNIEDLKKFVAEKALQDRILFTGFVSDAELRTIVSKTRIYINASCFEGFGMPAVEMMGRGIPTIVAANTAMPEVTMGLCRYYSPTFDSHALAMEILGELRNPTDDKMLEEISHKVKEQYNIKKIATEYWEFFNKCAGE